MGSYNRKALKRLYALSCSIRYDAYEGTGLLPHAKIVEPVLDDVETFAAYGPSIEVKRAWFDE